ncbi:amp-dependent synthetase ligase [Trichoderma arundinaceum]|uniref:Amp-dependent synthetase ligase n=1 Tax=Trichoderma arundinaceum TaxID=490622 RepID=A0A395NPI4_TRIAR|nr:amp-dependent synthetase ligase [Trichoderma arundinaceum]
MKLQSLLVLETKAMPGNNVISYFQEYSPNRIPALRRAWQKVIESEPIFRTVFDDDSFSEDGNLFLSWSESIYHDQYSFEEELKQMEAPRMIDPGTEFSVMTLAGNKSILIWHVHHALVDGYSARLLLDKVRTVMEGGQISEGKSYIELSRGWQMYQAIHSEQAKQFWQKYLVDHTAAHHDMLLPSPADQLPPNSFLSVRHATFSVPLQRVLQYCGENNLPLASVYYAAWALTLALYTGSDTVMFGVLFANRSLPIPGIRETVGPMMNTLPLLLHLDRLGTIKDFLRYTVQRVANLHQFEWSTPEQSLKLTSVLAMQYDYEAASGTHTSSETSYTRLQSSLPINIFLGPRNKIQINYDKSLYNDFDIENLGQIYVCAIETLIGPDRTLDWYFKHSLTPQLLQASLLNGNCFSTASLGEAEDTVISLFNGCVENAPDAIAAMKGDQLLSYSQLDVAAAKIASTLREMITPGDIVCVHADRSINWIIAIYAVLKAQAVYCPLDPALPDGLRDSYFQTSGSNIFLASSNVSKDQKPNSCSLCYSVEELLCPTDNTPRYVSNALKGESSKDVAYLCFTSGSSGLPKGVACTHEGIVAFQKDYDARLHMRPGLKVAQFMSPAFDGSIHEIFSCMSYGGTLLLSRSANPLETLRQADVAMITPSIAKMLNPHDYRNLEAIYLVGEQLPQAVSDAWSGAMPAYNMYGPTESSCGSTYKSLVHGNKVTIGRPVQSTRIYILDQYQNLLPPGVIGELYTAGVQVSPGYIGRPEETAKNFLKDTIRPATGQMMYRTQDRGYWTQSGEICLLGRADRQIKLRGFRLDLNDLEIRMLKNTDATSVAIARRGDILVAMVQPETIDITRFKEKIKKVLPPQALPRLVKAVNKFPLVNAGKIDYKAVAAAFGESESEACSQDGSVSPTSTIVDAQDTINLAWRAVLNPDKNMLDHHGVVEGSITIAPSVNIRDQIEATWRSILSLSQEYPLSDESNFVELGGHSILQLKLTHSLSALGEQMIPLSSIIENPCLGDQVSLLSSSGSNLAAVPDAGADCELGHLLTSPIEREWVEKYSIGQGSSSFNVNYVCCLSDETDLVKLTKAWNKVLKRHEILSSLYPNGNMRSHTKNPPQVIVRDMVDIKREINREFKLEEEHPIRVFLTPTILLLVASHIILDLTALNVILRDIDTCWNSKYLGPVQRSYSQTTRWSRAASQKDLNFWEKYLSGVPRFPSPPRANYSGTSRLSLAAVALALRHISTDDQRVILGAPYLNRDVEDLETVGLFLEPLPICIEVPQQDAAIRGGNSSNETWSSTFTKRVGWASQEALCHAVTWHNLLEHFAVQTQHPNVPFIEAMVTFHDNRGQKSSTIPGVQQLYTWCEGSKFKLMFEFSAISSETLMLRIEYDNSIYDEAEAADIQRRTICALGGLSQELSQDVIIESFLESLKTPQEYEDNGEKYFGMRLADL